MDAGTLAGDVVMESGIFDGKSYDGRMKNIRGNHVALVREGRAGHDVRVADSALKGGENMGENAWKTLFFDLTKALQGGDKPMEEIKKEEIVEESTDEVSDDATLAFNVSSTEENENMTRVFNTPDDENSNSNVKIGVAVQENLENAEEEIIAIVHAPSSLTQQIEDLVCSYSGANCIMGYRDDEMRKLAFQEIECITVLDRRVIAIDTHGNQYRLQERLL